jgi:hypothetical protein
MIKRMTKVTSLLVCAASIISIIPAYAADVKKIDSQEGTIYGAKAKGNAIYIDGEINGKDEAQYWMTDDGKYNAISGLSEGMAYSDTLLNKYVEMDDQNTYFDITDGKYTVIDDKVRENLQDDVASTIRKKIKADDDGRVADKNISLPNTLKFLEAGNGLTCFKGSTGYALKADKVFQDKTSDAIYGDYAGNYVDADYNLGSIKVGTTASSVYVKNTSDTYDLKIGTTTYEIRAVIKDNAYITTVGDNMYRWADLSIYGRDKSVTNSTYSNMTSSISFGGKYNPTGTSVPVLQSFSKTVDSDTIDGLKYSKNSTVYFCTDEDGKTVNPLGKSAGDAKISLGLSYTPTGKTKITGNAQAFCSAFLDTTTTGSHKLYAETLKLKSKEGLNYIDLGSNDNVEVTDGYSIQNAGGLIYSLGEGYIKVWDGDESFTKLYKVDGAMENMSLASKDNIIVWNEDDEVYSIIHNAAPAKDAAATTGTTAAATTGATATTTAAVGWAKATDGTWSYNKDGKRATGWLQDGATWYYLNATGVMQTGWINDNGTWYYLNASGAMLANTTIDGYILGASGAWIK